MTTAKATNWLETLDRARCEARWSEIPEATRKVLKHAPGRSCLAVTAQVEARLYLMERPTEKSTASTFNSYFAALNEMADLLLTELSRCPDPVPKLPTPAGGGHSPSLTYEDVIQLRVVLAWISSLKEEWEDVKRFVPDEDEVGEDFKHTQSEKAAGDYMGTVRITALVLKGLALSFTRTDLALALQLYKTATRLPPSLTPGQRIQPVFLVWHEKALARYALTAYECWLETHTSVAGNKTSEDEGEEEGDEEYAVGVAIGQTIIDESTVANAFSAYNNFIRDPPRDGQKKSCLTTTVDQEKERRDVFRHYFKFLSLLLLPPGHPKRPTHAPHNNMRATEEAGNGYAVSKTVSRRDARKDLQQVSRVYEHYLMGQLSFPRAEEYHEDVGEYVDQVIENWRTAGASGDEASPVVEVLYRAATKTFHSPRILRHLFTTLTASGNFNDALASLDTYLELIGRGKHRMSKGHVEKDFDSDYTIFETALEGIRVLCKYMESGKKALDIAEKIETWVKEWEIKKSDILAIAYQGVGIANSTWARQTPYSGKRLEICATGIAAFQKALSHDQANVQSWLGVALLQAETCKIDDALASVRKGLGSLKYHFDPDNTPGGWIVDENSAIREYKSFSVRLLHLLALLLTAKEDLAGAERVCQSAFDMLGYERDAVRELGVREKCAVLQLKITHITIIEGQDGSEKAIPRTDELLDLYGLLFDGTHLMQQYEQASTVGDSHAGTEESRPTTQKSKRSSIFALGKGHHLLHRKQYSVSQSNLAPQSTATSNVTSTRPTTRSGTIRKLRPKSEHKEKFGLQLDTDIPPLPAINIIESRGVSNVPSPASSVADKKKGSSPSRAKSVSGGTIRRMKSLGSVASSPYTSKLRAEETPPLPQSAFASSTNVAYGISPTASFLDEKGSHQSHAHYGHPHLFKTLKAKFHAGHHHKANGHPPAASSDRDLHLPTDSSGSLTHDGAMESQETPHNLPISKLPHPLDAHADPPGSGPRSTNRPSALPEPKLKLEEEKKMVLGVLREAWLSVAGLYRRANFPEDARMAVDEAASLATPDSPGEADVLAERGNLHLSTGAKVPASLMFEEALSIAPFHVEAIVGLCKVLLETAEMELPAQLPVGLLRADAEEEKRSAGVRALGMLEGLVEMGDAWDCAEVWWELGRALEMAGETDRARGAYWRVVELEDAGAVREWRWVGRVV